MTINLEVIGVLIAHLGSSPITSITLLFWKRNNRLRLTAEFYSLGGKQVKDEKNWYRCITREEMVLLIAAGFDYTNVRTDKFNNGNNTYYFARTEELERFLEMRKLR